MKTPGFTAESSLYQSDHHYRASISYAQAESGIPKMKMLPTVIPEDQVMTAFWWDCPDVKGITWGWDEQSICICNNPHPCFDWELIDIEDCEDKCQRQGGHCQTRSDGVTACFWQRTCCDDFTCMCECNPPWITPCSCSALPDGDIIHSSIEHNAVDPAIVEFVLESRINHIWWKGLNVPDGEGSSWDLSIEDSKTQDSVTLWAPQVHNGQWLTFSKSIFFGKHCPVYVLGNLDRLQPGDRVTFHWLQD